MIWDFADVLIKPIGFAVVQETLISQLMQCKNPSAHSRSLSTSEFFSYSLPFFACSECARKYPLVQVLDVCYVDGISERLCLCNSLAYIASIAMSS